MNLTKQESIFCQALAMTSLLKELSNRDFLNSDYYNENITFVRNNDNFKKIINLWGDNLKKALQLYRLSVTTTYPGESSSELSTIDYYRHIRNAVSHAKCVYETEDGRTYVTFKDKNRASQNQYHCEIKMLTSDVGRMILVLQNQIMEYLNRH